MVRSAAAVFAVLIIPSFAQAQEPQLTHTVVDGNTLWDLAIQYYDNPWDWRVIYEANRAVVEDEDWIYPEEILVIPGRTGTAEPATGDPAGGDPDPDPGDPGDPGADPPPDIDEVPADLIPFGFRSARPSDEVRSIFYSDTAAARASVVRPQDQAYVAVAGDAVYSAPWLIGLEGDPEFSGVIEGFADGSGRASTIRSFERVRVSMASPARVGAQLQVFRVSRTVDMVGQVVAPTGVMTVSTIGDGYVVGTVTKEYGRIQPGDYVRPLPTYSPRQGAYAEDVSGGSEAMIMGFAGTQVLSDLGHIAFLDLGTDDGVTIGDEFILYGRSVPTAQEGSLQVVGVTENSSAARILSMADDVFQQGVIVRLARKMR